MIFRAPVPQLSTTVNPGVTRIASRKRTPKGGRNQGICTGSSTASSAFLSQQKKRSCVSQSPAEQQKVAQGSQPLLFLHRARKTTFLPAQRLRIPGPLSLTTGPWGRTRQEGPSLEARDAAPAAGQHCKPVVLHSPLQ